jgi:acyl-CoA reductase-like NAD-dependent aldehyde dehydrogenase
VKPAPPIQDDPIARARMMLQAAEWAAVELRRLDRDGVRKIVGAVAATAHEAAGRYAEWAVRETGFGVVEHKRTKNEIASLGIAEHYAEADFVTPRVDRERRIVEFPRPAGVIFALTPSTNPISTLYFKVVLALMTRNAIVVSPHPLARECCVSAAKTLAEAAVNAGAPRDAVQVIEEPSIPLIEALMGDQRTRVILATGGTGVVRAAYGSGNPALGVGPGNAPVLVDQTADLRAAAHHLVDSEAFDNSLLCSSESVLVVQEEVADSLQAQMRQAGAYVCTPEERDRLRSFLFEDGHLNTEAVGKDATWLAGHIGVRAAPRTRCLLAPIGLIVEEEPLAGEKMCPVLSVNRQPDLGAAIRAARGVLRIAGAGHSAAIHSSDPAHVVAFAEAVDVLRVVVNAPNSTGVAGFDTHLAPTMTVGTGFSGASSIGENLGPEHLVNWSRVAYTKDRSVAFPDYASLRPWERHVAPGDWGPVSVLDRGEMTALDRGEISAALRDQIRRLVLEELRDLVEVS